ncbi:MAG: DMT family transporter [Proteobacteria bacterium]|nr:DMT family transporter [Pseudomonadota bacterium]
MMRANRHILMVAVSAILYGGIAAGGDFLIDKGVSVYEISLYTIFISLVVLTPYLVLHRELLVRRALFRFYIIYGLIGAALQLTLFSALFLGVPVAIAAMLLNTQPVWTTIIGHFWLKERAGRRQLTAVGIALVGLFILLEPWHAEHFGQVTGILFGLGGGLSLSLWVIWGRRGGMNDQHAVTITLGYLLFTGLSLLLIYPFLLLFTEDDRLVRISLSLPGNIWILLIIYVLITNLLPHLLFYTGIQKVKAVTAGMLLLMEPVSAALLATLIFGEAVTAYMVVGGLLILFSNYFILDKPSTP